jgi:hypothetical protein
MRPQYGKRRRAVPPELCVNFRIFDRAAALARFVRRACVGCVAQDNHYDFFNG